MSKFYPGQPVRYVGGDTFMVDARDNYRVIPGPVRSGDTGNYLGPSELFDGLALVRMHRPGPAGLPSELHASYHNLEPILPDGVGTPEEIAELFEPDPVLELVPCVK